SVESGGEHDVALSIANNTPNVEEVIDKLDII
ncbi:transporter, partial [Vibrio kanaloae]